MNEPTHQSEASFPHPPDGRRVVWVGEWLPIEGAPSSLPGVVTADLPDGWAHVAWIDKDGWYSPDAVYEMKNLREVSEADFQDRVNRVLASAWDGLAHDTPSQPMASLSIGDRVQLTSLIVGGTYWSPDDATWREAVFGGVRGLTRHHPGTVVEVATDGAVRVRWVDKQGEFDSPGSVSPDILAPIDEEEAVRLTIELRSSDWQGLGVG